MSKSTSVNNSYPNFDNDNLPMGELGEAKLGDMGISSNLVNQSYY